MAEQLNNVQALKNKLDAMSRAHVKTGKTNLWDVAVSINRTNAVPLDKSSIIFEDDDTTISEVADEATAYPGQIITGLKETDGKVYVLQPDGHEHKTHPGKDTVAGATIDSSTDGTEQLTYETLAFQSTLDYLINEEAYERTVADNAITKSLNDEIDRAEAEDAALNQRINELDFTKINWTDPLTFTEPFGKYGKSDPNTKKDYDEKGSYTITPTDGATLQTLFTSAFATDRNPTITQPSITVSCTNNALKDYEVGTEDVVIAYKVTFNNGTYSFGPDTGVSWTECTVTLNGTDLSATQTSATTLDNPISGSLTITQITENAVIQLKAQATHSEGTAPKTALDNLYEDGKISAGEKGHTVTTKIKGRRRMFAGTLSDTDIKLTSDVIRNLANLHLLFKEPKANWQIETSTANQTIRKVVIAIPDDLTITKILDVNDSNANIVNSFKCEESVYVAGENDYEPIKYKVYYLDAAIDLAANTYMVTIE